MRKSFTLIELIVVISIIAVLSALGASSYSGFQKTARDTRRKEDLRSITAALNQYYAVHNKYPAPDPNNRFTTDPWTPCGYGINCYTSSIWGPSWIPELVEGGFVESLPQDPINNALWPWDNAAGHNYYSYAYGNVSSDGQQYDLTTRLENTEDPDRCEVKHYRFHFVADYYWCTPEGHGGTYSKQIYEYSPNSL